MSENGAMQSAAGADAPGVTDWEGARAFRDALAAGGKRLVCTNGCFDLLHVGHVRYLTEARALGDALLVAVNGDGAVRRLKGPGRPVQPAAERAELLAALKPVDAVVIFEEERAERVLEAVRPHVYVKGGDYTPESLHAGERAVLEEIGAEIRIVGLVPGKSTSSLLRRETGGPSRRLRLGVLGSGRGSTLEGLLQAIDEGRLEAEVALVLADVADARILSIARARGIEAVYVDPGPHRNRLGAPAQKEMCDRLVAAGADLVVLAGFMRRVKEPLLEVFADRILNIHPSLLPKFPGREAWAQALQAGDRVTGCTVHLVDAGIDTGRILRQAEVPIRDGDTPEALHSRIQEAERGLFPEVIGAYGAALRQES